MAPEDMSNEIALSAGTPDADIVRIEEGTTTAAVVTLAAAVVCATETDAEALTAGAETPTDALTPTESSWRLCSCARRWANGSCAEATPARQRRRAVDVLNMANE